MHTQSREKRRSPRRPSSTPKPAIPTSSRCRLSAAELLRFFVRLLPHRALLRLPALKGLSFYDRLFTPLVTLWYLLFQRLQTDQTLEYVVVDAQAGGADRLNPKLSRGLRSSSTAGFSQARDRLPPEFLHQALRLQGRNLARLSPQTRWKGFHLSLLDGSTVRLRPHAQIRSHFPPHRNQHRRGAYWCLMRVVVTFCCLSGAALDCAIGSTGLSEQALGAEIILRALGQHLFVGDRNFGIFRMAQVARHSGQEVLLRLTEFRAAKLLGRNRRRLRSGDFPLRWQPSCHDQLHTGCSADPVPGRLIVARLQCPGFRTQWLCLFTTLRDPVRFAPEELVKLYGLRWHVELNLRYVKAQMNSGQLEVRSQAMARKEWLASLLAYNLVRAGMLCAALKHQLPPLSLSFAGCRRRLEGWLRQVQRTRALALSAWETTLAQMSTCLLPKRTKARPSEPRAKRHVPQSFPVLIGTRAQARKKLQKRLRKS